MSEPNAYVEIVEQPAKCALRFRYKCEGRSAGALPGVNSTVDNKTFPSIKIHNYVGRAVVVISCVTSEAPYRAHPHNIVGKEGCKKGICTIVINNEPNTVRSFSSLGIQCVKRKDIEESLGVRESIKVDPFRNGYAHKFCGSEINLNVVRLCFQVFIVGSTPNRCDVQLTPVVTDPIHDKKAMSDLVITKLSHCSAPATGGREVILLCDRISKDDIQIRFYEELDGNLIWETYTELSPTDIHKQVAICFKTPKYYNENITQPVMCRIQLKRLSDNQVSEPRQFQFLPCESDEDILTRKRRKIEWVNSIQPQWPTSNNFAPAQQYYQHPPNQPAPQLPLHKPFHQDSPLNIHLSPQGADAFNMIAQNQHLQQQRLTPETSSPLNNLRTPVPSPIPGSSQQRQYTDCRMGDKSSNQNRDHSVSPVENHQPQQPTPMIGVMINDSPSLVVRREFVTGDKTIRIVESNNSKARDEQQGAKPPLGNSLDKINTAELVTGELMNMFNSNIDLGSGLFNHLNNGEADCTLHNQQPGQQHLNPIVQQASTSARARESSYGQPDKN